MSNAMFLEPDYKTLFRQAYWLILKHHNVLSIHEWGKVCRVCHESAEQIEGILYVGRELDRLDKDVEKP